MYNPVVTFSPASIDACGSWRMYYPKLHIPGARFIFTEGHPPLADYSEADVAVVQRLMLMGNIKWLEMVRSLGVKIIYDLDDDLWALPKTNPARFFFTDQKNRDGLEACAEWADVFTVSTKYLQKIVSRQWGHLRNVASKKPIPVMVCENRIPLTLFGRQEGISSDHEGVVIGWSGSNTHYGDLLEIWPILHKVLEDNPEAKLEVVGHTPPPYLQLHPRVRQRQWVHISEYPARLASWNWDIIIAPLENNRFNLSKSNIKMQEAGALKRPCLVSAVGPYDDFVDRGNQPQLNWLLCSASWQWERKLNELIKNATLRKELGEAMYQAVQSKFRIEYSVDEWQCAIRTAYDA